MNNMIPSGLQELSQQLTLVRRKMKLAAEKSGRDVNEITLVAVTKTVSAAVVNQVIELGISHIAENKVQEAELKRPLLECDPKSVTHHLIGHLQTNKARKAVGLFDVIQSIDRPRIAESLNRVAAECGKIMPCLIEVKMGDEPHKTGYPVASVSSFIEDFKQYSYLSLRGLMMIAPLGLTPSHLGDCFTECKYVFEQHRSFLGDEPVLSMGMSDDFELAIEKGSNMIRLGRVLFGERKI